MNNENKIHLLEELLGKAKYIPVESSDDPDFIAWNSLLRRTVDKVFGPGSNQSTEINKLRYYNTLTSGNHATLALHVNAFRHDMLTAKALIKSYIEELTSSIQEPNNNHDIATNEIFIVHGHDEEMKQSIARTVEKLDLNPIILHEQPNKGRTVIQKFSDHSNVSFAIVLLSPDDMAYSKVDGPEKIKSRARQNVILEMGYFLGKLGPERVVIIYKTDGNFELPSDYDGVIYIPYDKAGAWKGLLVREMKACDYDVDANKVI